jgi:8-oxo-dGTP pyrophosphatase MutT (NUDIX family)
MRWPVLRRKAARVVLLDPAGRVLLLHASDPVDPAKGDWWEIPGGGVDRGESVEDAAPRELREETGVVGARLGPCIHRQRVQFSFGGYRFDSDDHIFVAWLDDPSAERVATQLESLEAMAFDCQRWWTVEEVVEAARAGGQFFPERLPELLTVLADTPEPAGLLLGDD